MNLVDRRKQHYEYETENILTILRSMLDAEVPAITIHSNMPFKAASAIQALLHRSVELGSDAKFLYENKRMMSSFILSRAIFETAIVMRWAVMSMERYLSTGKVDVLDDTLMLTIGGSRLEGAKLSAKNIITILQQLDKRHPSSTGRTYQRIYSWFSEYAHPNSGSTINQFATIDRARVRMIFGSGVGKLPDKLPIHALYMALGQILGAFQEYMSLLQPFFLAFDRMQDIMTIIGKFHNSLEKSPGDMKAKFEYDLVKEAPSMMAKTMELYGERDRRYHINDIIFQYCPPNTSGGMTVPDSQDEFGRIIYLGDNLSGNLQEARQRLAHELVHCLAPTERDYPKIFEEACACKLGFEFSGILLEDGYLPAINLLAWLESQHQNIIHEVRAMKTNNFSIDSSFGLSSIEPADFQSKCSTLNQGLGKEVVENLCADFVPENYHHNTLFPNDSYAKVPQIFSFS